MNYLSKHVSYGIEKGFTNKYDCCTCKIKLKSKYLKITTRKI